MKFVTILGYILLVISGIGVFTCLFLGIWMPSELVLKWSITLVICLIIGFILSQLEEILES